MATYYVNFKNQTEDTWTMAVYQKLPESVGLDSVSWKQTTVPRQGYSGVKWDVIYNVALADYVQSRPLGVYMASQTLVTDLGKKWRCIYKDGVQQLVETGEATPGHIVIANESFRQANLGIGMNDQGSVYKRGVYSGSSAQFKVEPTYYVGLFTDVVLGEVISGNVIVGPLEIKFREGMNAARLTAYTEGGSIKLNLEYGEQMEMSLLETQALKALDVLHKNPELFDLLNIEARVPKLKK